MGYGQKIRRIKNSKGRLKTEFQTTFVFLRPALERFDQRQTDFVLFVAVQPVGVAVDAAVFVAEDGFETGEFPAIRTYAEAVGLLFVAAALFEYGVFFAVAADAEGGGGGGIEAGFKHFCRAQPCGDEAVAVHGLFGFALLPVYAAVEHEVVAREVGQGVVNGEEAAVEQAGFVGIGEVFPLGFGVPCPASAVEVPFAAYAVGAVEGFAAAAVPFDERGEGEGVAVVFKLVTCAEVERVFVEVFMVAVEAAVAERSGSDAVESFNLPAAASYLMPLAEMGLSPENSSQHSPSISVLHHTLPLPSLMLLL